MMTRLSWLLSVIGTCSQEDTKNSMQHIAIICNFTVIFISPLFKIISSFVLY